MPDGRRLWVIRNNLLCQSRFKKRIRFKRISRPSGINRHYGRVYAILADSLKTLLLAKSAILCQNVKVDNINYLFRVLSKSSIDGNSDFSSSIILFV